MAFKIKLSLHGSKPVVSRTVALDPDMCLQEAALVFVTAFGWRGGRSHYFTNGCESGEVDILGSEEEEALTIGDLPDMDVAFFYDTCSSWRVDMEFKGETDTDGPKVLAWHGECPSQLFSGIHDFNRIRKAAKDPSDPYHDQAEAWLGTVPPYDLDSINKRLSEGDLAHPQCFFVTPGTSTDESLNSVMSFGMKMIDVAVADRHRARCPACGAECDTRANTDLPPSMIRNMPRHPLTIVCPRCRTETVLELRNDGFRIGPQEKGSVRPQDQQPAIYDALLRKDDPRDPFEEARYQAELGLLYDRYGYRKDNSGTISDCLAALDGADPRYEETAALCREAIVLLAAGNGRKALSDTGGFAGVIGATAMMSTIAWDGPSEDAVAVMKRAIGMAGSDSAPDLASRCRAAGVIALAAHILDDTDGLVWAASVLEDAASEAEARAESMESVEWWALCYLMEAVVCGLYSAGMLGEADRALKCMTGPFADSQCDGAPPAVRNLALFRRAMLFLSTEGDEAQALEDLERFVKSATISEDSGLFTAIRLPYALMLRAQRGAVKGEDLARERSMAIQVMSELLSAKRMSKNDAKMAFSDFMRIYVGRGYPYSRAREEFGKRGLKICKEMPDLGEFDIDDVWNNRMSWIM